MNTALSVIESKQAISRPFLFSCLFVAFAASTSTVNAQPVTRMKISAEVIARAVVTMESGPSSIDITAADISRGYAELSEPIIVRVRTNSLSGCVIAFAHRSASFAALELMISKGVVHQGGQSSINRAYVAGGEVVVVKARIPLRPDTSVGSYSLPLQVSAAAF